ncbi:putative membrane protein [Rhodobacter aestuarii]|uniref:Uncharacterized membrane protein n=1 Tax=Rhodobacter aestuarii TaxID=453582 RepID=A0A1N7L3B0_9RHOB|nr:DUF2254 domain-containing protein [Rhodobacter aestuarii]PTV95408.1 putative membrane protein [Rhodobacter aestuarii]SIS68287.1 Uncharacterized membrane protein [Rhodobacter aestuarii]
MSALWKWNLRQISRQIWVPIAAFAALGLATAAGAVLAKPFLPADLGLKIGADSVGTLLQILASSMLTVTTFSLSIMLSAFGSAAGSATPRAIKLLQEDDVSRSVLATFMGVFIFALAGLIGLQSGVYDASGRLVLFIVTLAVVTAVVVQLVRWIGHLADFGRLGDTLARLETAATAALQERLANPFLGGHRLSLTEAATPGHIIPAPTTGYLQTLDMKGLEQGAKLAGVRLAITVLPGHFVHERAPVAHVLGDKALDEKTERFIASRFVVAETRTYEQDPRFGILALSEVASRALSPAVNDPGTAIGILGRQVRVLAHWHIRPEPELIYPSLSVAELSLGDMMTDAFAAIARDGAGLIEVQIRLQKMLMALYDIDPALFGPEALKLSDRALALAEAALVLDDDKNTLHALNAQLHARRLPADPLGRAT